MDGFEDENPFSSDPPLSSASSNSVSHIDVSEPSSPAVHPARIPSSPTNARQPVQAPQRSVLAKTDYCCYRDQWLHSGEDAEIQIVDALKTSENSTSPYITYVIQAGNTSSRHRYSDFESLRTNLSKLYPTLIIPPIPSKQTIGDYAIKQGKAKEDAALIARRRRMLQTFLNRIARHPILSNEHVFHRFLDGEVSWAEVLHSPPISLLPKNILKAPAHNPTDPEASAAYQALPNPSAAHPLRRPDQRFMDSEVFTNKFATHMSGPMEKVTRRAMKRWSDYAQDHMDLGAAWNGFSLNEQGELSGAIEKTGQAIDATYISTTKLLQDLEQNWQEPLHEYAQFASIIKKLLQYRHQKHVQLEMTQDALETRRESLTELEKSESEARRLDEALGRGRVTSPAGGAGGDVRRSQSQSQYGSGSQYGRSTIRVTQSHDPRQSTASPTTGSDYSQGGGGGEGGGYARPGPGSGTGSDDSAPVEVEAPSSPELDSVNGHGSPQASHIEDYGQDGGGSSYLPPHPGPSPVRRRAPGMGLLSALSYTLHGMMDADPESARRNGISKTRENISQLEDALHLSAQDLKYASSTIQADLDRFQRQKVADFREMAISLARSHRDWCKKNLETWEEAKRDIAKIPEHPNRVPADVAGGAGPSSGGNDESAGPSMGMGTMKRRDSTATVNGR